MNKMNEQNAILDSCAEAMDFQNYDNQPVENDQITVKCSKLLKKCEQIKMENFRLINYIDQINKLVRKVRKQNAFICTKLDQNNDEYHKVKPTILQEIDLVINYGRTKLNRVKQSSNNNNDDKVSNGEQNYDLTIDHRNKRIKIENKVISSGNQTNQTINLASNLKNSTLSTNNVLYQITNNNSSSYQFTNSLSST